MLVIGDIHNNYKGLVDAYLYAKEHSLELISTGDIVDYGHDARNTILFASYLAQTKKAQFVEGNHDNKISRYIKGNDVKYYARAMEDTVSSINDVPFVKESFCKLYERMHRYIQLSNTVITHGGIAKEFWMGDVDSNKVKNAFLYGETDESKGTIELKGQQYPMRVYEWTNHIPAGKTVIVGHDRSPFVVVPDLNNNISDVVVKTNDLGGTVIFLDTGSGKGGFLSGVVLDKQYMYQKTVHFK